MLSPKVHHKKKKKKKKKIKNMGEEEDLTNRTPTGLTSL
jgi:hypothetical protein